MAPAIPSSRRTNNLNDVFVLGAGASVPYGFPTGSDLLLLLRAESLISRDERLVELLDGIKGGSLKRRLKNGFDPDEVWEASPEKSLCMGWMKKVRGSLILTIDQFLRNQQREGLRDLGKRLMARHLLSAERDACALPMVEASHPKGAKGSMHALDWIQVFLTKVDLLENWLEYLESTTFITFNYDRVLEFFVHRYLVVDKGFATSAATEIVDKLRIYHINGYLGPLQELPFGNLWSENSVVAEFDPLFDVYSSTIKTVDWTSVSSRLRTVWEDPGTHEFASDLQEKAKAAIGSAKRIFILGTSFIPENMEAIGLARQGGSDQRKTWDALLWATAKGLTEAQDHRAANLLEISLTQVKEHFIKMVARDFVVDFVNL